MKTAQITKKKVITEEKKITKKEQRRKKNKVYTETDGMTKMTKKTPAKMMKIADTGMDIGTDTETDSGKTTPVMNLKKKTKLSLSLEKIKTKLSLEKIKTKLKMTKKTKLRLNLKKKYIHLIPADVVVKLVVDFLYDHNLCHAFDIGHV